MPLFKLSAEGTVTKRKHNRLRNWMTWEEQTRQVMFISLWIGFLVGVGLTAGIIALTQSWFGWGW